jgi:predicted small secreted protein
MHRAARTIAVLLAAATLAACTRTTGDAGVDISTASPEELAELLSASAERTGDAGSTRFFVETWSEPARCMTMLDYSAEGATEAAGETGWLDTDGDGNADVVARPDELLVRARPEWNAPTAWVELDTEGSDDLRTLFEAGHPELGQMPLGAPEGETAIVPSLDDLFEDLDLEGATTTSQLGPGEVRGVATTGYRIEIGPPTTEEILDAGMEASGLAGLPSYTIDVQVDRERLVRRFDVTMQTVPVPGGDGTIPPLTFGTSSYGSVVELWDLGTPVDLPEIPTTEISSFGDLAAADVIDFETRWAAQADCFGDPPPGGPDSPVALDAFTACAVREASGLTVREYASTDLGDVCWTEITGSPLTGGG